MAKLCIKCGEKKASRKGCCDTCYQRNYHEEYRQKTTTEFHGDPDGEGKLMFYDGAFYIGQFKDGKRHGKGVFYFADGLGHSGVWQNGFLKED